MTLDEQLEQQLDLAGGDPGLRALALFHGAGMVGRSAALRALIPLARTRGVTWTGLEEAALQLVAFAGFPRAIEALSIVARAREGAAEASAEEPRDPATLESDGRAAWAAIYGDNQDKVLTELDGLLPGFDQLVLTNAYGRILSRPGLPLGERELLAVAALALAALARPLESHVRGALANGFAVAQVRDILTTCIALASDDARTVINQACDRLNRKVHSR